MTPLARCAAWLLCMMSACMPAGIVLQQEDHYGRDARGVWVRGPWAAVPASHDVDEVIDGLCPAIMSLSLAQERDYGVDSCGLLYQDPAEGRYYASYPSPVSDRPPLSLKSSSKSCLIPVEVRDGRGQLVVVADYHSHPWPGSAMSTTDRLAATQRWSIRIQLDTRCRILKLVPRLKEPVPGELYERVDRRWQLIGIIKPEDKASGAVTPVAPGVP